ncbi:glycosyltransferase [Vibrio crassostreae]|uniref:glycosyltransferase n=1 Tax=Vibrio crassostreae TaxID=246167 RepID=UPI001B312BD0|nr:glycosyltransferase [Vibrio crassostreae]CAK2011255.1 Glycosyl transferase family 2 [Vibrio crassostreae]CAK2015667.1 Glycosyl transferase family 2 [Vibrio crassostreae]CAK2019745.1 Glycosyl transferase family 2 [Vibrio crassostreae]CAK2802419.1 Glycosyl transferase family 2 [Vibrio crassostreae]CAK2823019.1 Glycosyl transferase family 2 [Vibrio crassostreae]
MSKTRFSIIIPFYNSEDFIKETILSVLDNKYDDFEIILIDDGSTDLSYDICNEFVDLHSNIIILRQENQGPNVARNKGLIEANGDYVLFIDADDLLESNCLDKLDSIIQSSHIDYVCYGINFFDNITNERLNVKKMHPKLYSSDDIVKEAFTSNSFLGVCWNKCISLKFIKEHSISFQPDKMHGRDILFSRTCAVNANNVKVIDDVFCHSRYHNGSFSRRFKISNIHSAIDLADKHISKFNCIVERKLLNSAIKKHFNYILLLSSFRAESYIEFKKHFKLIKDKESKIFEDNRIHHSLYSLVLAMYLSTPIVSWSLSKILSKFGYKPY